jgi:hypothetical protein
MPRRMTCKILLFDDERRDAATKVDEVRSGTRVTSLTSFTSADLFLRTEDQTVPRRVKGK